MFLIFLVKLLSLLPLRVLYLKSSFVSFILYYTGIYRKKIVIENLKNAFPNKTNKEINKICKKFYAHLCDVVVEGIKFYYITPKKLSKRFTFKNEDVIFNNINKNVFLFLAHFSNWEWFPYFNYRLSILENTNGWAVYLALKNKKTNDFIKDNRSRFNVNMIEKYQFSRIALKNLASGNQNIYGMLIDQSPHSSEVNGFVNFLGLKTPVDFTLDKISHKLGTAIFFVSIEKVKRGYYEVEFLKITDNASKNDEGFVIREYYRLLENIIIQNPQYWLWTHKRWKHKDIEIKK